MGKHDGILDASDVLLHIAAHLDVVTLARVCCTKRDPFWHACFKQRQRHLAHRLETPSGPMDSWGWIYPPQEQCQYSIQETQGTLVRFIMKKAGWSVFRGYHSFMEFNAERHGTYLIHDDDLRIRWVGAGTNVNGAWLCGLELEEEIQEDWEEA